MPKLNNCIKQYTKGFPSAMAEKWQISKKIIRVLRWTIFLEDIPVIKLGISGRQRRLWYFSYQDWSQFDTNLKYGKNQSFHFFCGPTHFSSTSYKQDPSVWILTSHMHMKNDSFGNIRLLRLPSFTCRCNWSCMCSGETDNWVCLYPRRNRSVRWFVACARHMPSYLPLDRSKIASRSCI